jgi:hypothetical protein
MTTLNISLPHELSIPRSSQHRLLTKQLKSFLIWLFQAEGPVIINGKKLKELLPMYGYILNTWFCAACLPACLMPAYYVVSRDLSSLTLLMYHTLLLCARWLSPLRQLEEGADRANREMDIRSSLRQWDRDYPEIHHELIVRWIAGAVVSICITSIYNGLKPQRPKDRRY